MKKLEIYSANKGLRDKEPLAIIRWIVSLKRQMITTTNFGPYEGVLLHMVARVDPEMRLVWIDSGYNTKATYRFAERLIRQLGLNIKIYVPATTAAHREAVMDGVPDADHPLHDEFKKQVKFEPFQRAMDELQPEIWITALRRDQTSYRETLDIVSEDKNGVIKVAPLMHWTQEQVERYLSENDIPIEMDYNDPTKLCVKCECGLHLPN